MKTAATTRLQANIENISRWHQEIPLYNALPSIDSLKLVRVPLQAKDRNDHQHTDIDPTKTYLCCENGKWFMGKFNQITWGWKIDHGWTHSGLGHLDVIYEVHGLPDIPAQLIERERVPLPPEEDDEE